jgi:hypothetical protein
MRTTILSVIALIAVQAMAAPSSPASGAKMLSRIPFSFERNAGQFPQGDADWVAHRNGYYILLGPGGASILPASVKMQFTGARGVAKNEAQESLPGKVNYLIGNDPKRWVRDVETCRRVVYHDVYDGVDVAWYGSEGQLEYDLVVRPGADTSRIALHFEGARKLSLAANGDLRIETSSAPLILRLPAVYQQSGTSRQRVESHYVLRDKNTVAFALAAYDKSRPLVIDPTLVYAAWFPSQNATVTAMGTDTQGNIYVGGNAVWLPTVNAVQAGTPGFIDPFVIKFDPTGTTMLYSTFVGGSSGSDLLNGLAVDSTGNAVATGRASSQDFPAVGAAQPSCLTLNSAPCGFVFRLNPSGNGLVYSTYMTASASTPYYEATRIGNAVAVDGAGNAYVALGAFIEKYTPAGSAQYTSSLMGGSAITADAQGFAYVAGGVNLPIFPGVPGARDATGSQCTTNGCTCVAKLSADGTALVWAAVLGSSADQIPHAIARDPNSGVLYVAGETTATDLPVTADVIQSTLHGQSDGYLASVSADGSAFGFVTYLGGSANDEIYAMTLTSDGHIVVAGDTLSPDFPVTNAVQPILGGNSVSLFSTENYGASWTAAGTGLPSSNTNEAFSVDPTNPLVIVAATTFGLFRTTDGGASWSPVGYAGIYAGLGPGISRSFANPEVLYALTIDGELTESTDGGATWTLQGDGYLYGSFLVASPTDANTVTVITLDGTVYVIGAGGSTVHVSRPSGPPAASPDGSIYLPMPTFSNGVSSELSRSTDNGKTWQPLPGAPGSSYINGPPLSVCTVNPSVLYGVAGSGSSWRLYRSNDTGGSWVWPGYSWDAVVAPSNCQVVYAEGSPYGFQVSFDGGFTWALASGDLTTSAFNAIFVDPTNPAHAWVAPSINADGFVAKISNDGKTLVWSTFYGGSNTEDVRGVAIGSSGNVWIAGTTLSTDLPVTTGSEPVETTYEPALFLAEISDATATCTWQLAPASAVPPASGGIVNFGVAAPSGCAWSATPSDTWITPASSNAGAGSGPAAAVVSANNTGATRMGTIGIGDQTFVITQPSSGCQYSLDNTSFTLPSSGGEATVNVTAGPGCPWSVAPNGLTIASGGGGTGSGSVTFSAPANPGTAAISFAVQVAQTTVTIKVAENCTYSLSPLTFSGSTYFFAMTLTPSASTCQWSASTDAPWLTLEGLNTGTGSEPLDYSGFINQTGTARTFHVMVGSQTFLVTQDSLALTGNSRSFVSTLGNDANTCTVTAPCQTLSRALAMTNWGGEIVVLNSGSYDQITVSQAVTISAVGVTASITATSGNAVTINTLGNVTLNGLGLHGQGTGAVGILVDSVGILRLYHVTAENFANYGLEMGVGKAAIYDSRFTDDQIGLDVTAYEGPGQVFVHHTSFDHNSVAGVYVSPGVTVVTDSSAHFNGAGFDSTGGTIVLARDTAASNATALSATNVGAVLQFSACSIALNSLYSSSANVATIAGTTGGTSVVIGASNGPVSPPAALQ